jgi:hypothetical protein
MQNLEVRYEDPATGLQVIEKTFGSENTMILRFTQGDEFRAVECTMNEWASLGSALAMIGRPSS